MFKSLTLSEQDLKNIEKLKDSEVSSRRVVGRGTLVADAADIRNTKAFKKYIKRASQLFGK